MRPFSVSEVMKAGSMRTKYALFCVALLSTTYALDDAIRVRPATWAQPVLGMTLSNVYKVSEGLYRSEQPEDDHIDQLKRLGIKSVLSLRQYHSDDELSNKGIALYRVKMDAGNIIDAEVKKALEIIVACEKPVLVHCRHGSDRTGVVIAAYRISHMNWGRDEAIDEMQHGGFGYHGTWYPNIMEYLKTFSSR